MATHQEITGITDEEMVNRMVNSYGDRFGTEFWRYFKEAVLARLPVGPLVVDMGCGPGLFLEQLSELCPSADMYGYDITQAMLDYAIALDYEGKPPVYRIHDIAEKPLLFSDGTVHLFSMTALLHLMDDPISVCREVSRVLAMNGYFLLYDWVRTPIRDYLDRMGLDSDPENEELIRKRLYNLFPVHNKYTEEDWQYLLKQAGMEVVDCRQLKSPHFRVLLCQKRTGNH